MNGCWRVTVSSFASNLHITVAAIKMTSTPDQRGEMKMFLIPSEVVNGKTVSSHWAVSTLVWMYWATYGSTLTKLQRTKK